MYSKTLVARREKNSAETAGQRPGINISAATVCSFAMDSMPAIAIIGIKAKRKADELDADP